MNGLQDITFTKINTIKKLNIDDKVIIRRLCFIFSVPPDIDYYLQIPSCRRKMHFHLLRLPQDNILTMRSYSHRPNKAFLHEMCLSSSHHDRRTYLFKHFVHLFKRNDIVVCSGNQHERYFRQRDLARAILHIFTSPRISIITDIFNSSEYFRFFIGIKNAPPKVFHLCVQLWGAYHINIFLSFYNYLLI